MKTTLVLMMLLTVPAFAQVSAEEAQQRMQEKEAARRSATATQPNPEVLKLQEEIEKIKDDDALKIKLLEDEKTAAIAKLIADNTELKKQNTLLQKQLDSRPLASVAPTTPAASIDPKSEPKSNIENPLSSTVTVGKIIHTWGTTDLTVVDYGIGKVPLLDVSGDVFSSSEAHLFVHVKLTNNSKTKILNYSTWRGADFSIGRDFASAEDNFGNALKRIDFGITTKIPDAVERTESIYPGKSAKDTLIFQEPIPHTKTVTIEIPAKNIGEDGDPIKYDLQIGQ